MVDTKFVKSPLKLLQQDCEFHRQRAIAAQDEVERLHDYIARLEEEKRYLSVEMNSEVMKQKETILSMDVLNRSLARQNDILRSRHSVGVIFDKHDRCTQTTSSGTSSSSSHTRSHETQTDSGVWVTIQQLPVSRPVRLSNEFLKRDSQPYLIRRSQPRKQTVYPESPTSFLSPSPDISLDRPPTYIPLLAPSINPISEASTPVYVRPRTSTIPPSYSNPRHSVASRRGKSLGGGSSRKRWVP
jgi:hypothetical protein